MKKATSYGRLYQQKNESKMNKSSSSNNLQSPAHVYVPKERWKSKLKRAMITKHALEHDVGNIKEPSYAPSLITDGTADTQVDHPLEYKPMGYYNQRSKDRPIYTTTKTYDQKESQDTYHTGATGFNSLPFNQARIEQQDDLKNTKSKGYNSRNRKSPEGYRTLNDAYSPNRQIDSSSSYQSHKGYQPAPLSTRNKVPRESSKKIFTTTRPMLTPQAMPKMLKFRFDNPGSKRKLVQSPKLKRNKSSDSPTKSSGLRPSDEFCEENVVDDSEEQSVFLMNPTNFAKRPQLESPKIDQNVQTESKLVDQAVLAKVKVKEQSLQVELLSEKTSKQGKVKENKDQRISDTFATKLSILEEFYDKIRIKTKSKSKKNSKLPELPVYYQGILDETSQKLGMLKRHSSKEEVVPNTDLKMQMEINKDLDSSIKQLREENSLLEVRYNSLKERFDNEKRELNTMAKDLKERNQNLLKTIKLQMKSTTTIDKTRQKLSDRCKEMTSKIESLTSENEQQTVMIEQLQSEVETLKDKEQYYAKETNDRAQFEKTKGTVNDKDTSYVNIENADQKGTRDNSQLEYQLRKMVNISKQTTSNISEIINESLELLNDISKTIEVMSPIMTSAYTGSKLNITNQDFTVLLEHKVYLCDKYVRHMSFSKRVDKIQTAQEKMKLLLKSIPKHVPNLGASQRLEKKALTIDDNNSANGKSLSQYKNDHSMISAAQSQDVASVRAEYEKLTKAKEQEITARDIKITKLEKENEKNKSEIEELNDLISKMAAERVHTNSNQSYFSHFVNQNKLETSPEQKDPFAQSAHMKIKDAKSKQKFNKTKRKQEDESDDDDHQKEASQEGSFKLGMSHSIKNPFDEGKDDEIHAVDKESNDSFDSKFLDSDKDEESKGKVPEKELKKADLQKQKSSQRKQWGGTKNSDQNLKRIKSNNLGSDATYDEGDDSSFLSDFGDLAGSKKSENKNTQANKQSKIKKSSTKSSQREKTMSDNH